VSAESHIMQRSIIASVLTLVTMGLVDQVSAQEPVLPFAAETSIPAGNHDFMRVAAERIHSAIPRAERVTVKDCGHFAFLECAGAVRGAIDDFFKTR
jgi:pimeloyl-ACP methyl ester carboxylesterase